ncbi:hypothetical protein [Streptomyces violascens]|uniref:Uncharacterized protein n=1 Tax=Streptomyces violascens TaxID=67381 RepID=A0ABQ3QER5_9ACTN|nr:hypothetical protein [Streptomyces violascens]GGU00068.1 hypothetical protein GCM10010289_20900 [Streptomyces violascens]GHI35782.1 hypothetical protein Sviol_01900 [Streptomyces violascens]
MTETQDAWRRQTFIPITRRQFESEAAAEPMYAAMVRSWVTEGRTVPGRPDWEWNQLVNGFYWPS